ncbi:Uncharacterized membrane protein YjjP, DUF1212 family [Pustulibacterium marinum]|uniref:Uncharacterized membrane protein YjjP, DUF1212 family n=1 Tax=Pustulibacterium marinum TaxID=1224947 RepID=A0A1I7EVH8_9FLAO|nr:threonine/serine exporter family protein [Pustulibacterium marinum]SFU27921.1 Uncharacterized membrane protein YjjP, DUF1212 family [Pustulibacterium marinum]
MKRQEPAAVSSILLETGTLLMSSGANTNRVRITMKRIAESYGYQADFLITHRAIMLTLKQDENQFYNEIKQAAHFAPNFRIVSGLSRLSWQIKEEQLSTNAVINEISRLKSLQHFPRWQVLCMVALACSSFCRLAGGNFLEMMIVFMASFTGLFVKQELGKRKVNVYMGVFLASFITTMISGGVELLHPYEHDNMAFITSILYLIPGIPLINSMMDILDGYSLNGIVRAVTGFAISFAIAAGLLIALLIYHVV